MTKSFEFETDAGAILTVDVFVECRDRDGADATYDIEWIGFGDTEVAFESLSDADKVRLNRDAERCADDAACDAAQEWAEGAADRAYDEWKDRDL